MYELHDLPRALPHFGSGAGCASSNHASSSSAAIESRCGPAGEGRLPRTPCPLPPAAAPPPPLPAAPPPPLPAVPPPPVSAVPPPQEVPPPAAPPAPVISEPPAALPPPLTLPTAPTTVPWHADPIT